MINGEQWLKNELQCKLTANYNRKMNYSLPVKPSPNLPNDQAVNLYEFMPLKVPMYGTETNFNLWLSLFTKSDFSFTPKPNLGTKSCL
jgi:hypothetical protein